MRPGLRVFLLVLLLVVVITLVGGAALVLNHPGKFRWAYRYGDDWRGALEAKTGGANGLRIRECEFTDASWFRTSKGQVLFETHDARETQEFLGLIEIDDAQSGPGCLCSGQMEVAVRVDGSAVARFNVKHGWALYSATIWPGDAVLTDESAESVSLWLTAHGIAMESPSQAREWRAADLAAIHAQQDAILGAERAERFRAALEPRRYPRDEEWAALVAEWAPDEPGRIAIAMRLACIRRLDGPLDDGSSAFSCLAKWLDAQDDAAVADVVDPMLVDDGFATAELLFRTAGWNLEPQWFDVSIRSRRMDAARRLLAKSDDTSRELGRRLLDLVAAAPDGSKHLIAELPRETPDASASAAAPTSPTEFHLEVAARAAAFCEPALLPRLRALAAAAPDSARWTAEIERRIAARATPATPPSVSSPAAGDAPR